MIHSRYMNQDKTAEIHGLISRVRNLISQILISVQNKKFILLIWLNFKQPPLTVLKKVFHLDYCMHTQFTNI